MSEVLYVAAIVPDPRVQASSEHSVCQVSQVKVSAIKQRTPKVGTYQTCSPKVCAA
jgi:hypothetical protein